MVMLGVKIRTERMAQRNRRRWEGERIGANMARNARAGVGAGEMREGGKRGRYIFFIQQYSI